MGSNPLSRTKGVLIMYEDNEREIRMLEEEICELRQEIQKLEEECDIKSNEIRRLHAVIREIRKEDADW